MTKDEFLAGIPFKMSDTEEIQPVYSYVNVGGLQCIQMYTVANPNPMYHCKVIEVLLYGIKVRNDLLGYDHHVVALWEKMFRVGDGIPVRSYTRDLMQANIYEDGGNFKVVISDLYDGRTLPHLTVTRPTLDAADLYARNRINYK